MSKTAANPMNILPPKNFSYRGLCWLALVYGLTPSLLAIEAVDFNRDIRPLLSDRCYLCHGPDEAARQADLRLDSFGEATKSAIVPGNAITSKLIARISSTDADTVMPPGDSHKARLTEPQIELFRKWIKQGAKYQQHWAYTPPRKAPLPVADATQFADKATDKTNSAKTNSAIEMRNPVDAFVEAKLRAEGLHLAPPADRLTLLRRLTLDLTGLPPTPEEGQAYLDDLSAEATQRVVTRLLNSPAYGEHMARYWLDAARYADSNGYQYDLVRQQWAWRDWVIDAFNRNLPFDQFTIEQLAGDLLTNASDQQRLATGFNRNHPITIEGGVIEEEYRTEYVIDRVVTTGTVWLGATLICSRCHDHKYDPTTQREFYQIFDFFNQIPEKGLQGFAPQANIASPFQAAGIAQAETNVSELNDKFLAEFDRWQAEQAEPIKEPTSDDSSLSWIVPQTISQLSTGGAQLSWEADKSIFVQSKPKPAEAPKQDVYELLYEISAGQAVALIRLEALKDSRLPGGGTSLSNNSNFVLTEITAELDSSEATATTKATPANSPATQAKFQSLKFSEASADYSQRNYSVAAAIDGKHDQSGWAVDGNEHTLRANRTALFALETLLAKSSAPQRLRIKLHFQSPFDQHALGKFRISLAADRNLFVSDDVRAALALGPEQRTPEQQLIVARHVASARGSSELKQRLTNLATAQSNLNALLKTIPPTMIMQDQPQRRDSFILVRGQYDKPSEKVLANTPSYLPPLDDSLPRNRLGFARWLVAPSHPLTARVTVNRLWQQFFGIGLVDTPEDFGLQGNPPSHPQLLDWLAVDFIESGWNIHHVIRTIVQSKTYQQSSVMTLEALSRDPNNRLLARGPRLRLDAEAIRDSALAASGLLTRTIGGPSAYPYHPPGLWLEVNNRQGLSNPYEQDHGENLYRRSLYTFGKRSVPAPSMSVFDAPEREVCLVRRSRTNTPLQAFVLLHDPQFVESARKLAERMLHHAPQTLTDQLTYGFMLCVGRPPTTAELKVANDSYAADLQHFTQHPELAKSLLEVGESPRKPNLPTQELAALTNVARLLMNLSEFVTKS